MRSCANKLKWVFIWVVVLSGCASSQDPPPSKSATENKEPKFALYKVEIAQMKFSPGILKVKKGDHVVFVNRDIVAHDVTEETKKNWSSSTLQNGEYWTLVATESADYFCSIHTVMKGKIIVE